jgi:hypothetical protein
VDELPPDNSQTDERLPYEAPSVLEDQPLESLSLGCPVPGECAPQS